MLATSGLSCLAQAGDGLLHFRWYERVGANECRGSAQHDLIVFPGEATFSKVSTLRHSQQACITLFVAAALVRVSASLLTFVQVGNAGPSSRIYTLSFPSDTTRTLFFW